MRTSTIPPATTAPLDAEMLELVERAQAGDSAAFADLYDQHVDAVYGFIYRKVTHKQTTEDLTSDVFLRAFKSIGRFEYQGKNIRAWLFTIARNRVADHYKSAHTRRSRSVDVTPDVVELGSNSPERITEGRVIARRLGEAMETLSDSHREIIELRFIHEMSTQEAAEVMGRSYEATKQLQFRALRALQQKCRTVPGLAEFAAAGLAALINLLKVAI
ncbi:MAG: RNA polymerase sigma-70 factor (ECF subfamily) [Nitriliruptoraceae bacterium]|jgi:RNA polymerase sigma-70 factor (ECF subfamily)